MDKSLIVNQMLFRMDNGTLDFHPTPKMAIESLLDVEEFQGNIFEPASGDGAISRVLEEHGYSVISSDIQKEDFVYGNKGVNFFNVEDRYDNIITNPPFNIVSEFALHALDITKRKVAFMVQDNFLHSIKRYELIFKNNKPNIIWKFQNCIPYYDNKNKKWRNGGALRHIWVIWDKENPVKNTIFNWIPKRGNK